MQLYRPHPTELIKKFTEWANLYMPRKITRNLQVTASVVYFVMDLVKWFTFYTVKGI